MPTSTTIAIDGLRLWARHGALPQERVVGGEYRVDASATLPMAIEGDRLDRTLNYAEVADIIRREMSQPADLLETVAGRIAEAIVQRAPQAVRVTVRVTKLNPPLGVQCQGASAQVCIEP